MSIKNPNILYGSMYCGNLSEEQANLILSTREQKVIPNLKKSIFLFPKELIYEAFDRKVSIRGLIEEKGLDINNYIAELRDYQTVGTAFMYLSPRSMLADGVGAGKTVEISALLNTLKSNHELTRFLMVVEASALGQTLVELMKFTGLNIIELPSRADAMRKVIKNTDWRKVDGLVTTHSALRSDVLLRWISVNLDENDRCGIFNTFILDESSVIKNRDTKTFSYFETICGVVDRVHLLNATAFETCIMDIYNQFDAMYPSLLPSRYQIEKNYCVWSKKSYWKRNAQGKPQMFFARDLSGYKNQEVFKAALKLVYFGRSKKEVGKELPHNYIVYTVEPTNEQSLAMAKGYRYMEVLNCPTNIPELNIQFDRKSVPKLDRLVSLIENEFTSQKIMIYCFNIEAQEVIARELREIGKKVAILNGSVKMEDRLDVMNSFNCGDTDVIVTNIQKSLNLYAGDVCIFYSMSFTPSKMEQIRGRIDRSVDDKLKTYIMLLYKGTDEYAYFTNVVKQRARDSRDLTIDAESAVDFFIKAMDIQ